MHAAHVTRGVASPLADGIKSASVTDSNSSTNVVPLRRYTRSINVISNTFAVQSHMHAHAQAVQPDWWLLEDMEGGRHWFHWKITSKVGYSPRGLVSSSTPNALIRNENKHPLSGPLSTGCTLPRGPHPGGGETSLYTRLPCSHSFPAICFTHWVEAIRMAIGITPLGHPAASQPRG